MKENCLYLGKFTFYFSFTNLKIGIIINMTYSIKIFKEIILLSMFSITISVFTEEQIAFFANRTGLFFIIYIYK